MDATTAAVILIFVISIFSGFGHNQGYTPPSTPPTPFRPPAAETPKQVVSVTEPPSNFAAVDPVLAHSAIKNYVFKYRSSEQSTQIASSIVRHSQTYDVNPKLVAALIARESKFNPRALSSSGAMGLGQLLPSTAKGLGVDDGFDIDQNARGTVRYLKSLIDRFKGSVSYAIAAYLEGPNQVMRSGYSAHTRTYVEDILLIYSKI